MGSLLWIPVEQVLGGLGQQQVLCPPTQLVSLLVLQTQARKPGFPSAQPLGVEGRGTGLGAQDRWEGPAAGLAHRAKWSLAQTNFGHYRAVRNVLFWGGACGAFSSQTSPPTDITFQPRGS